MLRYEYNLIIITCSLILILLPVDGSAQSGNKDALHVDDSSKTELKTTDHSFYAGTGFGSNMIYLGSTISRNQPYFYGNLTYGLKNKFYASVSPVHLSGSDPFLAFYIGALNYNHTFNSWFDIAVGTYRYQVPTSLSDTLFSSFTYGDLSLGFDWNLLYTKLTLGGLISEENQVYFQLRNSRYFQTPDFFKDKASISFDPYFNLLLGTLIKVETSEETKVIATSPGRKWKKYRNQGTVPSLSYLKKFGMMEIDFGIPISFNTDKFSIEAELNYTLPLSENQVNPGPKGFVFLLSAFIRIH